MRLPAWAADFPAAISRVIEENLDGVCLYASGIDGSMTPYQPEAGYREVLRVGQDISSEVLNLAKSLPHLEASPISLQWKNISLSVEKPLHQYLGETGLIRRKAVAANLEIEMVLQVRREPASG